MPHPAQPEPIARRDENFTRKARILLDLFGPSGVERLRQAGLQTGPDSIGDAELSDSAAEAGRTRLLDRFRKEGLFDAGPARQVRAMQTAQKPAPLTARIAEHLDEAALEKEHPAVIAMVLKSQPKSLQLQAIHALPGPVARATIRFLRG